MFQIEFWSAQMLTFGPSHQRINCFHAVLVIHSTVVYDRRENRAT